MNQIFSLSAEHYPQVMIVDMHDAYNMTRYLYDMSKLNHVILILPDIIIGGGFVLRSTFIAFLEGFLNGSLQPFYKSLPLSHTVESDTGGLPKVIVGANFHQ